MPPAATSPQEDGDLGRELLVITEGIEGVVSHAVLAQEGESSDVVMDHPDTPKIGKTEEEGLGSEENGVAEEGTEVESATQGEKPVNKQREVGSVVTVEKVSTQVSYAAVVQNKVEEETVELQIEEIDGMPTARIPDSFFEEAQPLWEDFLIGKFLAKAPFVGGIHALVNKIWSLGDKTVKIEVYVVDQTTVRFRIKDERTRNRVLRRGMWNLCGVPVVLSKWSPIVDMEQKEIKTLPLWVIVKNVPPKYFSWKVLSAITSPLGSPKKLHPDTEACKSFEEAKVFVEVDLTKKLPKFFSFKSEKGGDTIVEFVILGYHRDAQIAQNGVT